MRTRKVSHLLLTLGVKLMSERDMVEKLVGQWSDCRKYYRDTRDNWVKYYKQYRSFLDLDTSKDYYKWRSKLFIPATARAVDGFLPDIMLTLFGSNPFFDIEPREAQDVLFAPLQKGLLLYDFYGCDFFVKAYAYLKQYSMYGTTFGKCFWKKETHTYKEKILVAGLDGKTEEIEVPKEDILIDQPWFEPLDIFGMVWGKKALDLSNTFVYQMTEKTMPELKAAGIYSNLDELENLVQNDKNSGEYEQQAKRYVAGLPSDYSNDEGDARKYQILEYWNSDRTKTCTIGGGRVLIRPERDNPFGYKYDPFVKSAMWANPFEFMGMGIPEKCKDVQDQINSEVNQRLDNRNLRQNLIFKVRRGANVNTRTLRSSPGAVWLTDDMDALDVFNIPDISTAYSFQEEQMLEAKCEEITGVTRFATGSGVDTRKTATEVSVLTRMSSKSFALHLRMLEEDFIKPVLQKFMYLNSKFMDKEKAVKILGPEGEMWTMVKPGDVRSVNYDLIANGASEMVDKNMRIQQMIQYAGFIAQDPTMMPFKQALNKKMWEAWGNKDYDIIMRSSQINQNNNLPAVPPLPGMVPTNTAGGRPVPPTDMRMPMMGAEGNSPMPMGGGGQTPPM